MEIDNENHHEIQQELPSPESMKENQRLIASEELLRLSKVDISSLKPVTQCLDFISQENQQIGNEGANNSECEYRLLELNKELLDIVESGDRLVFRGEPEDFPVLCSENRTFSVREAETSNSLLLLPELQHGKSLPESDNERSLILQKVVGIYAKYLELKPVPKMKIMALKDLLEQFPYKGPANETESPGKGLELKDLEEKIQASDAEIVQAIANLPVCLLQGEYRWLDFDYLANLLSDLIEIFNEDSAISWKSFNIKDVVARLPKGTPDSVLEKFFFMFGGPLSESGEQWSLKEEKVCRYLAEVLLKPARRFNFDDFMQFWQQSVPHNMNADIEQLKGVAVVDESGRLKTIEYFPVEDLPEDPQERFDHLFRHRQRWKDSDLLPYLEDLAVGNVKVGTLLTKFCRSSTVNGVRVYNARETAFSKGK